MDRGQAHTLEGIVAAGILVASLAFALQATAVTPLSTSTASQHIENQQRASAEGVLATAEADGSLKEAVLSVNESTGVFHNASEQGYYANESGIDETTFGRHLDRMFGADGIAFNVNLIFYSGDGNRRTKRFIYRGAPSDNAVTASRFVTLYETDNLVAADGTTDQGTTLGTASSFYAPKTSSGSQGLYNVVEVEVVVWRM